MLGLNFANHPGHWPAPSDGVAEEAFVEALRDRVCDQRELRIPKAIPKDSMRCIALGKTEFHDWSVFQSTGFGRLLFLNGDLQSSEYDQELYHRTLFKNTFASATIPIEEVLILGEGLGGLTRLVTECPQLKRLVTLELDPNLVREVGPLLPQWHRGTMNDVRIERIFGEAVSFLRGTPGSFDAVLMDFSDPLYDDFSPALGIEFLKTVADHVRPGGRIGIQAGPAESRSRVRALMADFGRVGFERVLCRTVSIPSFNERWAFIFGTMKHGPSNV